MTATLPRFITNIYIDRANSLISHRNDSCIRNVWPIKTYFCIAYSNHCTLHVDKEMKKKHCRMVCKNGNNFWYNKIVGSKHKILIRRYTAYCTGVLLIECTEWKEIHAVQMTGVIFRVQPATSHNVMITLFWKTITALRRRFLDCHFN